MINELEEAVVGQIKERLTAAVSQVNIQRGIDAIPLPGVHVSTEEGKFRKVTSDTYEQEVTVYVDVVFKELSTQQERRKGIYQILEGIVQCLLLQKLGLKILPIVPKDFRNVTSQDDLGEGKLVFTLTFGTAWNIKKLDDEAVTDLITIGLGYYLNPDADAATVSDTVTLQEDL